MKKIIFSILLIAGTTAIYFNRETIIKTIVKAVVNFQEINFDYKNSYYLKYDFQYVDNLDDFVLRNKQDLINLYYTVINNGNTKAEFFCPDEYKNCLDDVKSLVNNPKELSNINAFVHPYNSFDTIETEYDSLGRVMLNINKTYKDNVISSLNDKIEEIITNEVKDEKDKKKIIKIIHDYIISNTKYDKDRTDKNIINYESNTAYGVLFQGYGICSGYADAMALFLNYYEIPNFKVSSENHVWNAVYLDNKWYHLDLTWDDPILSTGEEIVDDTYFLISTKELKK